MPRFEATSFTLEVGGQVFRVTQRPDGKSYDYEWLNGKNPGYGFTATMSSGDQPVPHRRHERAIVDFLSSIDPSTGYVAE